jgi:uncharacterized protein
MEIQVEKLPNALRKAGLEKKLIAVCSRNDVVFLALFGSYVRGEQHRGSDIDIAIEFDPKKDKTLLDLIHLEGELSRVFKHKVDLGIFSSINPYIIDAVKKEMLVIYERR